MDKNNSADLQRVIEEATEFTRVHLQAAFLESLLFTIYYIFGITVK